MKQITILLAEDHLLVRQGLRTLVTEERDFLVVGEAQTGREAVRLTAQLRPAVVVMDISMPLLNGLEATRQILKALPKTKVIILSAHCDDNCVEQVMGYGASGYLIKQTSFQDLAIAVREVYNGKTFFSTPIAKRLSKNQETYLDRDGKLKKKVSLSLRELGVLQLVVEGKCNKQIADELGITLKTVVNHRQHFMSKLDIHEVAGLTRYAISAGIIKSDVQVTMF